MAEHKLTSLPVVDTKDNNKCLGMVDTLDVATFVLSVAPDATQLKENELKSLEIAGRAMALEAVRLILSTLLSYSIFGPTSNSSSLQTLLLAIRTFLLSKTKLAPSL
jgi:CBS domain-containing protein